MSLIVPAQIDSIHPLLRHLRRSAHQRGFPEDRILEIELVVEEVLANIIAYAYPDKSGSVEMACTDGKESGTLSVVITDWGIPFDLHEARSPEMSSDLESHAVGGWGIHLIKELADEVHHSRESGKNVMRLVFRNQTS